MKMIKYFKVFGFLTFEEFKFFSQLNFNNISTFLYTSIGS